MTAYETIIGIDIGLDGGIAAIGSDGAVRFAWVMPTVKLGKKREYDVGMLMSIFGPEAEPPSASRVMVFVEKAQARPGQGVTSMFSTGYGYGLILGMVIGLRIPHTIITPQTWQRMMYAGLYAKAKPKEKSVIVAQRLWPSVDWTRSERATKPHDGMTDAALIAEAGRRSLGMGVEPEPDVGVKLKCDGCGFHGKAVYLFGPPESLRALCLPCHQKEIQVGGGCPYCAGTGEICTIPDSPQKCDYCHGTGAT